LAHFHVGQQSEIGVAGNLFEYLGDGLNLLVIWGNTIPYKTKRHRQLLIHIEQHMQGWLPEQMLRNKKTGRA